MSRVRRLDYSNIAALGEFLLGYPNEYNKYTERPLLDPDAARTPTCWRRKMRRKRKIWDATERIS